MDNIILIGMPGSGKSSVGVVLAKTLGYDFLDVDLLIQQQQGALLQELLDEKGVEWFLDAEADAIASVHCSHTVIAPGGSCICRERAIELIKRNSTPLYEACAHLTVPVHNQSLAETVIAVQQALTQYK